MKKRLDPPQLALPGTYALLAEEPEPALAARHGVTLIIGVDEAGRGPLAGPVVAAAVALMLEDPFPAVGDSKALTPAKRQALLAPIQTQARAVAVTSSTPAEIDARGILVATLDAMRRAVLEVHARLQHPPCVILVDGSEPIRGLPLPQHALVGGDARCRTISAASILAKEAHDQTLLELHTQHPAFGFDRHMGYGTAEHLQALRTWGPTEHHRRSFEPLRGFLATGVWPGATEVNLGRSSGS